MTDQTLAGPYALTGKGVQAINSPASITVSVTTFPPNVTNGAANPANYYHVALLTPGDASGWYAPVPVIENPQRIPLPSGCTQLGYACINGAQLSVSEVAASVQNWQKQPWDRNPQALTNAVITNVPGGTPSTQAFSYTVPAGRLLALVSARVEQNRSSANTGAGGAATQILVNGQYLAFIQTFNNTVGFLGEDAMQGGSLILPAGVVVSGLYSNGDSGGNVQMFLSATGYLFDA